jgi:hypothetical protein
MAPKTGQKKARFGLAGFMAECSTLKTLSFTRLETSTNATTSVPLVHALHSLDSLMGVTVQV